MLRFMPPRRSVARGRLIIAAVVVAVAVGGLTVGCGSDQANQEEFMAYWKTTTKVVDREEAESGKVQAKADGTAGALNSLRVLCDGYGRCDARAATRLAAIQPPRRLTKAHKAFIRAYRRSAGTMSKIGVEIRTAIGDPGLDPFAEKWQANGNAAIKRVTAAYDRWWDAAVAEGQRLGIKFSGD